MMSINKRTLTTLFMVLLFGALLYSPIGWNVRMKMAERIIETRFQPYTWILVGKTQRDQMLKEKIISFCGYLPDENRPCF
jgi:hypothetical protein